MWRLRRAARHEIHCALHIITLRIAHYTPRCQSINQTINPSIHWLDAWIKAVLLVPFFSVVTRQFQIARHTFPGRFVIPADEWNIIAVDTLFYHRPRRLQEQSLSICLNIDLALERLSENLLSDKRMITLIKLDFQLRFWLQTGYVMDIINFFYDFMPCTVSFFHNLGSGNDSLTSPTLNLRFGRLIAWLAFSNYPHCLRCIELIDWLIVLTTNTDVFNGICFDWLFDCLNRSLCPKLECQFILR